MMKKILPYLCLLLFAFAAKPGAIAQSDLIITAVFDGNLPGQLPKGIELYVVNDIADMSVYGVGSANNGQGTDGVEFTFPEDSFTAGSYVYIATESIQFTNFFGFAPNYIGNVVNINGDDAIELFMNEVVVDVFGEIEYATFDGSWSYLNGWAYRVDGTGPDGTTHIPGNWTFSGTNALSGVTTNAEADLPIPVGTYSPAIIEVPVLSFTTSAIAVSEADGSFEISVSILNPDADNATSVEASLTGGTAANGVDYEFSSPQLLVFPAGTSESQSFSVTIIDNDEEDGDRTIEFSLENPDNDALIGMGNMVVTIVDDEFSIPVYDIAVLREFDVNVVPLLIGELLEARGVVHGINMRPQGLGFTIIDPTDGIAVFQDTGDLGYEVQEGDSVHVIGELDFFNGIAQIDAESVLLISQDEMIYEPVSVTELNEATESNVVRLDCVTIVDESAWTGSGSGFNVEVTDGMNSYQVRIASPVLDLYNANAPSGILHISGIGGQFDNSAPYNVGYQLLPRYAADIVEAGEECVTSVQSHSGIEILVYPNPVIDQLTISGNKEISDIRIVDLSGRTVQQHSFNGMRMVQLQVSDLPSGMFLLEVHTSSGRAVTEIVKP